MEVQVITNMKSLWDPFHGDKPRERLCVCVCMCVCGSVVPNSSFRLIVILCGNYLLLLNLIWIKRVGRQKVRSRRRISKTTHSSGTRPSIVTNMKYLPLPRWRVTSHIWNSKEFVCYLLKSSNSLFNIIGLKIIFLNAVFETDLAIYLFRHKLILFVLLKKCYLQCCHTFTKCKSWNSFFRSAH